jgi:hypothetical protein
MNGLILKVDFIEIDISPKSNFLYQISYNRIDF